MHVDLENIDDRQKRAMSGSPVQWFKDGSPINVSPRIKTDTFQSSFHLAISSAETADSGMYTAKIGKVMASAEIRVLRKLISLIFIIILLSKSCM